MMPSGAQRDAKPKRLQVHCLAQSLVFHLAKEIGILAGLEAARTGTVETSESPWVRAGGRLP